MTVNRAYLPYTEGLNDLKGVVVPEFSYIDDLVTSRNHANN